MSTHPPKAFLFGIAGPSGSGKTTLMDSLATIYSNAGCVREPSPSRLVSSSLDLRPATAYAFQRRITLSRRDQAIKLATSPLVMFDRTFEEDREVFLRLYLRLGYLTASQVHRLSQLSVLSESDVGPLNSGIILTGSTTVLGMRVRSDSDKPRPTWLLNHIDLEFELYQQWIDRIAGHWHIEDTSTLAPSAVIDVAVNLLARLGCDPPMHALE